MYDGVWEAPDTLCSQRGSAWRCCFNVLGSALLASDLLWVKSPQTTHGSHGSWWRQDCAWAAKFEHGRNEVTCGIEHVQCVAQAG